MELDSCHIHSQFLVHFKLEQTIFFVLIRCYSVGLGGITPCLAGLQHYVNVKFILIMYLQNCSRFKALYHGIFCAIVKHCSQHCLYITRQEYLFFLNIAMWYLRYVLVNLINASHVFVLHFDKVRFLYMQKVFSWGGVAWSIADRLDSS